MSTEIPAYIANLEDAAGLRNVMANARNKGREDVYWAAFRRLCAVEGMNYDDPLHRDFYQVFAAYEELLREKHSGKNIKANYTRRKLKNESVEKCLEDWAISDKPTQGFDMLVAAGMPELTAEYLVTKYPNRFSAEAVAKAKKRLAAIKASKGEAA